MLELRQQLKLEQRVSQQQILLSTLLQLQSLNLEQRIKEELELNPVLEELEDEADENSSNQESTETRELSESEERDDSESETTEYTEEIDWGQVHLDDDHYEIKLPLDKNKEEFESQDPNNISPHEKLIEQLQYTDLNESQRQIAEYIIWNIRDDGYLDPVMTLETIAHLHDCKVKDVEKVLTVVQRLEPRGIASRNLRECLLLQIEDSFEPLSLLAYDILKNAFDEFSNRKFEKVAHIVDADLDEIKSAIQLIAKLNPKPGDGLFEQKTNYIIPDFMVERQGSEFIVSLNDWNSPQLRISSKYRDILSQSKDKSAKKFIRDKMNHAQLFISAIEQRKLTMMKVMNAILSKQFDFFDKGPQFLKPMIMKDIADIIAMDISTVSRVANGKYVQCEFGVFELKSFFTEKMETLDGEEVSTQIIKEKIQQLCQAEDKSKPFSDDQIVEKLLQSGFKLARRTVAKYREQLGIAVARLRREL